MIARIIYTTRGKSEHARLKKRSTVAGNSRLMRKYQEVRAETSGAKAKEFLRE